MSSRLKWILGAVAVVVVALVIVASIVGKDRNLTRVTTAKVGKSDLVSTVSCNGRVQAKTKVEISSQVMGQIVNLAVEEGDLVKKGDFLLQIDKAQYDASTKAQQANLEALFAQRESDRATVEQARRDYDRERKNFEAKITSEQVMQKAKLQLDAAVASLNAVERRIEQARAQLLGSRDSLGKTTLVAPMNGVVTARPVEQGENAVVGTMNNPGTVLLTISDMSIVEAEMEVDETDIPNVKVGQKAKLTLDAWPDKKYEGVVTEIGGSPITKSALGTDATAVNFKVKVQLKDPPAAIRPGFSVVGGDRDRPSGRSPRDPDPGARRRRGVLAQARREGEEAGADPDSVRHRQGQEEGRRGGLRRRQGRQGRLPEGEDRDHGRAPDRDRRGAEGRGRDRLRPVPRAPCAPDRRPREGRQQRRPAGRKELVGSRC